MILKVLKIARGSCNLRIFKITSTYLIFTNRARRSCDFLFIVHSTKLRHFHGNLIDTPREYNLGLIVLLSTNQN